MSRHRDRLTRSARVTEPTSRVTMVSETPTRTDPALPSKMGAMISRMTPPARV